MAEQSMRERVADAMIGSDALQPDLRAEASIVGSSQREPFLMFADAILPLIEEAVTAERERIAGALDVEFVNGTLFKYDAELLDVRGVHAAIGDTIGPPVTGRSRPDAN